MRVWELKTAKGWPFLTIKCLANNCWPDCWISWLNPPLGRKLTAVKNAAKVIKLEITRNSLKSIFSSGFSLTQRTHHCRHCGRALCSKCSDQEVPIIKFGENKPVRVCQVCFNVLKTGSCWIWKCLLISVTALIIVYNDIPLCYRVFIIILDTQNDYFL